MKAFLKALGVALYERIFLHYKPTLIGIGLAAAILVVEQATTALQGLPDGWAKLAASLVAVIGMLLKQKAAAQPQV